VGSLESIKVHLIRGTDPNSCATTGHSALVLAAKGGHTPIVSLLLDALAAVDGNPTGDRHGTPLAWACVSGNVPLVRLLVQRQANVNHLHGEQVRTSEEAHSIRTAAHRCSANLHEHGWINGIPAHSLVIVHLPTSKW